MSWSADQIYLFDILSSKAQLLNTSSSDGPSSRQGVKRKRQPDIIAPETLKQNLQTSLANIQPRCRAKKVQRYAKIMAKWPNERREVLHELTYLMIAAEESLFNEQFSEFDGSHRDELDRLGVKLHGFLRQNDMQQLFSPFDESDASHYLLYLYALSEYLCKSSREIGTAESSVVRYRIQGDNWRYVMIRHFLDYYVGLPTHRKGLAQLASSLVNAKWNPKAEQHVNLGCAGAYSVFATPASMVQAFMTAAHWDIEKMCSGKYWFKMAGSLLCADRGFIYLRFASLITTPKRPPRTYKNNVSELRRKDDLLVPRYDLHEIVDITDNTDASDNESYIPSLQDELSDDDNRNDTTANDDEDEEEDSVESDDEDVFFLPSYRKRSVPLEDQAPMISHMRGYYGHVNVQTVTHIEQSDTN